MRNPIFLISPCVCHFKPVIFEVLLHIISNRFNYTIINLYRNIDRAKVQFDFVKHTNDRGAFEDEIELPDKLDSGSIERIISALRYDCPELFQVNFSGRYSMKTRNGEVHAVRIPYGMGKGEYDRKLAQCREILAQLARNAEGIGREEAERYVYE